MDARTPAPPGLRRPLRLAPNRIPRFHRGGALLDAFRDTGTGSDGDLPEDWVGSTTRAWRPPGAPASDEGLSSVDLDGDRVLLADLVRRHPTEMFGEAAAAHPMLRGADPTTGLLVKLLDAGERLPVHCHPTRSFARRHLGSAWGKTEAWIVLAVRQVPDAEPPGICIGFRRRVAADELRAWIESGASDRLLEAMHAFETRPGDVWLVPGGQPHAIGAGVFLAELQEPTDFSIVAELRGFPIAPADAHLGLGWDRMLDAFDRRGLTTEQAAGLRQVPRPANQRSGLSEVNLFDDRAEPFFRASRLEVRGSNVPALVDGFAIGVVLSGRGRLSGPAGAVDVVAGDALALPAAAGAVLSIDAPDPGLELLLCQPPAPGSLRVTG